MKLQRCVSFNVHYRVTPKVSKNNSETISGVNSMIPMSVKDISPVNSTPLIDGV